MRQSNYTKYINYPRRKKEGAAIALLRPTAGSKMLTNKKGWIVRILALIFLVSLIVIYVFYLGLVNIEEEPIYLYCAFVISFFLLIYTIAWIFYRSPVAHDASDSLNKIKNAERKNNQVLHPQYHNNNNHNNNLDLVSVIIPVYNQEDMIQIVIDSISKSTYRNIEIIVVDDGSTDNSGQILDNKISHNNYPNLKVIHKRNEGKRKAVATGFFESKGKYIVLIDSDSVVDDHAIEEFINAFNSNPDFGAVTGHTKPWNSDRNFITKCQDAWYDYEFNIFKACQSYFHTVTCCCGCLSAYRRKAIHSFMLLWMKNNNDYDVENINEITIEHLNNRKIKNIENIKNFESDDASKLINNNIQKAHQGLSENTQPILSTLPSSSLSAKSKSSQASNSLLKSLASYDDSEDRALTTFCLLKWKTAYVYSATAYTDVPDKLSTFIKQQKRWIKSKLRANLFAGTFFWSKKKPIMSFIFYSGFAISFISPIITIAALLYGISVLHHIWSSPVFLVSVYLAAGFFEGLDYKMRDPNAKYWKYRPIMNLVLYFMISWLIFYAILKYKNDAWLTR